MEQGALLMVSARNRQPTPGGGFPVMDFQRTAKSDLPDVLFANQVG